MSMAHAESFKISQKRASTQHPTNRIEMNLSHHKAYGEDTWVMLKSSKGVIGYGVIKHSDKCAAGEIYIEDYILSLIFDVKIGKVSMLRDTMPDTEILIEVLKPEQVQLSKWKQMGLSASSRLLLSNELHDKAKGRVVRLYNPATGATADYRPEECDVGRLKPNEFVINFYERELMLLREPGFIKTGFYKGLEQTHQDVLAEHYPCSNDKDEYCVLKEFPEARAWEGVRKKLRAAGFFDLQMYFLEEPKHHWYTKVIHSFKALYQGFMKSIIGEKPLKFKVIRPLPIDENSLSSRLSETSFQMLGLEVGEKVVISYHGKSMALRAHMFPNLESMKKVNVIFSEDELNYAIGIPSDVRRELGIYDVNTVVTVKRDAGYIFWKKSHMQILPVIGLLISIISITDDWTIRIVALSVLSVFSIYLMLSEERAKAK